MLFTLAPLFVGWSAEIVVSWTLISLFAIVFVSDVHYMVIPNRILLFFVPLLLIERISLAPLTPWWDSLLGSIVGFLMLFIIALISKGGMGGGDIKLFAVIGLALGAKLTILAFFLSTFVGTIFGLIGMAIGRVKRGEPMPFGPAIAVGTMIAYFFGDTMIEAYVNVMM